MLSETAVQQCHGEIQRGEETEKDDVGLSGDLDVFEED